MLKVAFNCRFCIIRSKSANTTTTLRFQTHYFYINILAEVQSRTLYNDTNIVICIVIKIKNLYSTTFPKRLVRLYACLDQSKLDLVEAIAPFQFFHFLSDFSFCLSSAEVDNTKILKQVTRQREAFNMHLIVISELKY